MTETHMAASTSGPAQPGEEPGPDPLPGTESATRLGKPAPGRRRAPQRPDTWIPLALLGVFVVLWALVLTRPTFLTSFDLWVRDHVQSTSHADLDGARRWPLIKHVADLGGGPGPMAAMTFVALAAAWARRSWRPLGAAAAGYAALGLVLFLKAIGNRPGPSMDGQALTDGLGYFPSGHTGNTMLGYGTSALILAFVFTGRRTRQAIATAMTLFALAMGFALVWMDYHWLSDVLGSYALCGTALFVVARILSGSSAETAAASPASTGRSAAE